MRRPPGPPGWGLTRRLAWRLAAVMLLAMVLAAGAVVWRTVATIRELDDAALQDQARLVADHLGVAADGTARLDLPPRLEAAFRDPDAGSLYVVLDREGRVAFTSDPAGAAALQPFVAAAVPGRVFRLPAAAGFAGGMLAAEIASGPWRIVVAQGREQQEVLVASLLREFLASALWLLGPMALAVVAIAVLTTRHGLRPLREASVAAARIGPEQPGLRLPDGGLPTELAPLVGAVNGALDRLDRALAAQRRFVGDAAHALRTPLAVLTARVDALDPPAGELRADCDRMRRLVDQMLTMARLDGGPPAMAEGVDLRAVAAEAIAGLAPIAIGQGVELALGGEVGSVPVRANWAVLVLALENLLDNAIRVAPRGSVVEVVLARPATLAVLDRGPGVDPAERAAIFSRFHTGRRLGAGLGLAIVAEIAAAHGGAVRAEARQGGGAAFVLSLPGGPPQATPG